MKIRRVVTGHDANAKAIVTIDDVVAPKVGRPGALVAPIWLTEGFPIDNDGDDDMAKRRAGTVVPNGTACRVIEFSPGVQARNHRTSSLDYVFVMSGEIDMEMDDTLIHLKAGDVLVQRGTIHNWINNGTAPCTVAFVLIDAKAASAGDITLEPIG